MFFGGSSFASSPFADPGGVSIAFTVNGVRMNVAVGNVVIEGKSIVLPDGNRVNLTTGNVEVKIGKNSYCYRRAISACNRHHRCDIMEPDRSKRNGCVGTNRPA